MEGIEQAGFEKVGFEKANIEKGLIQSSLLESLAFMLLSIYFEFISIDQCIFHCVM